MHFLDLELRSLTIEPELDFGAALDASMLETPKDPSHTGGREDAPDARRIELSRAATPAEVMAAIEALSPKELLRLRSYAKFRMKALGRAAHGRSEEDLMSEAVTVTLAGGRRWNKDAVNMIGHLCGVVRSLSSHWGAHVAASEEILWQSSVDADGNEITGALHGKDAPTTVPDAERELMAREEVERIARYFADDSPVTEVLQLFQQGMKGPDVKAALGISQREFETILKRLRRGVSRMQREGQENA